MAKQLGSRMAASGVGVAVALVIGTGVGLASPTTERVSLTAGGGQADGASLAAVVSSDCRYVGFSSGASNLVPGDTNGRWDVFVRDRVAGTTTRVDVSTAGAQATGTASDFDPYSVAISADGRFVAFGSFAPNLVTGDTNGTEDVFVHDMVTGVTTRVSVGPGGRQLTGESYLPFITADGRFVTFTNAPGATGRRVWIRDRRMATVRPVSVDSHGHWLADSQWASVSADGSRVAFDSLTSNWQVYVHDMVTGATRLKSVSVAGGPADGRSLPPSISADGRYVAFDSPARDLVAGDTNGRMDVFVADRLTNTIRRVDLTSTGHQATGPLSSNGLSDQIAFSPDGRYIAFSTLLLLVPGDTNNRRDVYVRDTQAGTTTRMSVSSTGSQLSVGGFEPALCAGPSASLISAAAGVVPGDTNAQSDAFLRTGP